MPSHHGQFVWYELMTSDAEAALAFYRDVVGWDAADAGMPGMTYMLLKAGDLPVAGLMGMPAEACAAGAKPGWIGYVGVDDVDASAAAVKNAGGQVHREPMDIPGVGRFAVFSDPQGAVLALFKGLGDGMGPSMAMGEPGRPGWHELMAADGEAAFAFYAGLFGWRKDTGHDMGPMGIYQLFNAGGNAIGGMMTKPPAVPAPFWTYYFNVPAIDAAAERVKAGGGQVINGPMEVPGGAWIIQCLDPQGVMFALVAGCK